MAAEKKVIIGKPETPFGEGASCQKIEIRRDWLRFTTGT
jgi:hypothetical protein